MGNRIVSTTAFGYAVKKDFKDRTKNKTGTRGCNGNFYLKASLEENLSRAWGGHVITHFPGQD